MKKTLALILFSLLLMGQSAMAQQRKGRAVRKNSTSKVVKSVKLPDDPDLVKRAQAGDAAAQEEIGWCYYDGKGVEQSYTEAAKWYRKAAEQGNAEAQLKLGGLYYEGKGVEQSYTDALKWWRLAADQGHASSQKDVGKCYLEGHGVTKSKEEGIKWLRKAAEQGNEEAIGRLEDLGINEYEY